MCDSIIKEGSDDMGKLLVIEGTDCSGKATQTEKLVLRLREDGYKVGTMSFPVYESSTGQIIGACLLGKPAMCDELLKEKHGFFEEGGGEVESLVASLFYAADRRYNLPEIKKLLDENDIVVLDRYVTSNMAHRGGMLPLKKDRLKIYKKLDLLEYKICELPRPDYVCLLYLPYEYWMELKKNRSEILDEAERNEKYLKNGEKAYLELASLYDFNVIDCVSDGKVKSIDNIHEELYGVVRKLVRK